MAYTEVKESNGKRYYYRVRSIRKGDEFRKVRIYLGKGLTKEELIAKSREADIKLNPEKRLKSLRKIIPEIKRTLSKNKIRRAGIFGSYARGEERKDSDIDILVEPPKGIGFKFAGIELELKRKLKKNVDLVSYNGISPFLKDKILNEEIRII
ncbi:MAG TPA: nucleotidyltransferase family protein [Nanoarchaeota archaeon]|nr:nucleotidyltransferase family protein [Nanoarchaeota archaeon]HIH51228.1 nucleotidyltransferase family protein [Nanoarchaeota archaeon]